MTSMLLKPPAEPFAIGLAPLQAKDLLQIDDDFLPFRKTKQALYESQFDDVCMAEPDTTAAQAEVQELLLENLKTHHSKLYDFEGKDAVCSQTGKRFSLHSEMPIADIALLIPEDLVLMRRDESGWRLAAASLSFPSSWNLGEKFSKPLEAVHGPVPMSDKMSLRINRIFDALQPSTPLWRSNWSLDGDGELRHDRKENHRRSKREKLAGNVFLRTEFQTLHKLWNSGDVLFTIRIKTGPIADVLDDENGRAKLAMLHKQYLAMTDAERDYKGINHNVDGLLNWLAEQSQATDA